jgi:hypothetical protein
MVPELQKLLSALHKSNLTSDELFELTKQIEGNRNIGQPRENTTPEPREQPKDNAKTKSPTEQAAIKRNLLALRRALSSPTLTRSSINKFVDKQDSPPVLISLPKSSTDIKVRIVFLLHKWNVISFNLSQLSCQYKKVNRQK